MVERRPTVTEYMASRKSAIRRRHWAKSEFYGEVKALLSTIKNVLQLSLRPALNQRNTSLSRL